MTEGPRLADLGLLETMASPPAVLYSLVPEHVAAAQREADADSDIDLLVVRPAALDERT